jgi:transketolase
VGQGISEISERIRNKVIEYHKITQTGHVGSSLSCVEIMTALFYKVMKDDDIFILSKGHASGTYYVILNDKGKLPTERLYSLEWHPTLNPEYGINATTGCLGHGISIALGMAIAEPNHKVFVLLGDGECDEGQVWEAMKLASELHINNLYIVIDCNKFQAFKIATDINTLERRFTAFGGRCLVCNGHNAEEIIDAMDCFENCIVINEPKPKVLLADTIKGKGCPEMEDTLESHYQKIQK